LCRPYRAQILVPVKRLLVAAVALTASTAACSILPSPAVLVFHNRSDVPIALYPAVTVGPCSTMEFDSAAIEQGKARFKEAFLSADGPDGWVPAGSVQFAPGVAFTRPTGATEPLTVVVSALPLRVEGHRLEPAELPDCGGEPAGIQ
jgi:hypothetical protein